MVPNGTTSRGFLSDGVTSSQITLTESQSGFYGAGGQGTQGTPTALEYIFAYANGNATRACSLNNVPPGHYSLYLYGKNDNTGDGNRGTVFVVSNALTAPITNGTVNVKNSSTFILGNDYVQFNNIIVGADGTINFTFTHNPAATGTSGNSEGDFNGLQLVAVVSAPPLITAQPVQEILYAGKKAYFAGAANGRPSGTVTYQWQTNGVNLNDGATGHGSTVSGSHTNILVVSNVGNADQLNYRFVVTGTNSFSTNGTATTLTIQAPSGEASEAAVIAAAPSYYYRLNETVASPAAGGAPAFDFEGGDNGVYGISANNGFNAIFGPTTSDGFPGFSSANMAVQFANGVPNENITISSPWNLNTNTVTITAWINPNNGTLGTSQQLVFSRGGDTVAGFGFGSTLDVNSLPTLGYTWNNDPNTYGWNSGLEVPLNQWSFVALVVTPTNATVSIMNASGLASATHVYPHVLQSFNGAGMIGDDPADSSGANSFPGSMDDVAIFSYALSSSQVTALFTNASGQVNYPPYIAVQPVAHGIYPTQTTQFTVNAGGSGTLTYQWQADIQGNGVYANLNNGVTGSGSVIAGATTSTLTISNISSADANNYQVIVSSTYPPAATSVPALLTVIPVSPPQNITISGNQPVGQDWNTTAWSDGLSVADSVAAYPGSSFEVLPGSQLHSVNSGLNVTFPGASLTVDGINTVYFTNILTLAVTTNIVGLPSQLSLKHSAPATTVSFQSLTMNGGQIDNADDGLVTVAGSLTVVSNTPIVVDPVYTVINFDTPGSFNVNYVGQGAFSNPGHNYWNPVANNGTTSAGVLDDGATASLITLTSHEQFTYNAGGGVQGQPVGLEAAYEGATSSGTENNSLNNVPPGTYDLYIYGVNGAGGNHDRGTRFTVWSDLTPTNTLNTFNTLGNFNKFVEGDDYVVFRNVQVGAGGTINFSYVANALAGNGQNGSPNPPPNTESDFNGLQLVKKTASPVARSIDIGASLAGSGTISFTTSETNFVSDLNVTGTANTFSGQWNVVQGALLGSGLNSLGTNSITVGSLGVLETLYDLNNSNSVLILNGRIFLHQNDTFKSVLINGIALAPGTYSAATLAGMNATMFPATWPQQSGSTVSTSSGSIKVITSPAPVFTQNPTPATLTAYQSQTVQFSILAALGNPPISYHWQFNSINLSDGNNPSVGNISGSTTTNLTIGSITASAGSYNLDIVATNLSGSSTSQVAVLTVLAAGPPTTATLLDVQTGVNDWNSAADWDIDISALQLALQYPGSTNIVPAGTVLNTPALGGSNPFPGARLIIEGDGNFVNNAGDSAVGGSSTSELRAVEPNSASIYFKDLQMLGGQIDNTGNNVGNPNRAQSLGMLMLSGEIDILANTAIYSDSGVQGGSLRTIQIDSWLTGTGNILYSAFDTSFVSNNLVITCVTNTFSGQWDVVQGALLGGGNNSLGTNSITVETGGALETAYNLNDTNATLTLNGNGKMFLHSSDVFEAVTINGTQLSPGTYGFATLTNAFPANFPATWLLQIGSTVTNGSGSVTILTGPVPTSQSATIGQFTLGASSLSFSGSNGAPFGPYYIYGTTNLVTPRNQWNLITNGLFDGNGAFNITIPAGLNDHQHFYSIQSP